MPNVK
jgi:hypothetical protein